MFLPANVQSEFFPAPLHIALELNSHVQLQHINILVFSLCFTPSVWLCFSLAIFIYLQNLLEEWTLTECFPTSAALPFLILWSWDPAAHQKRLVPQRCINPARGAWRWGLPSYLLPWPPMMPCLGRGPPHWPPGYRGPVISSTPRTLYLSQASAVGMDGPGLAQGRAKLFNTSHN